MKLALIASSLLLALPAAAQAAPTDNAIQPSPAYFGKVVSGTHPTMLLTVKNVTQRNQYLRSYSLAGAGGRKFTFGGKDRTCLVLTNLKPGESCQLRVRVATTKPEFWQTTLQIMYGPRLLGRKARGQFNSAIFAHVVAA